MPENGTSIVTCPACGARNRVSTDRSAGGAVPVCGKCRQPLSAILTPVAVTDATFARQVEQSPLPVLLDLWAPWCGPCRMLAPVIDQLAQQMGDRIRFAKLNTDENPHTAGRFNISGIPTLLILKNGREVDRLVGVHPAAAIQQRLQRHL